MKKHLFLFNVVGLSPEYLDFLVTLPNFSRLMEQGSKTALNPTFPCLTLPGQATLTTGSYPNQHGIVANGFYYRDRLEVSFWDQYRTLVQTESLWDKIKQKNPDFKTAVLFWQSMLYASADYIITPKPIHGHHNLIQWCYSKPVGLYERIAEKIEPFNLMSYWGPFASPDASKWITKAAIEVLKEHAPDMMLIYMPHLDYSCQKLGPDDPLIKEELKIVDQLMGDFLDTLDDLGLFDASTIGVVSEYSLSPVSDAICPNRILREAGLLNVRDIEGGEYLDIEMSKAFAMVDHQIAHIYTDQDHVTEVMNLFKGIDGIDRVLGPDQKKELHIDHERSGEILLISDPSWWFAYYWWLDDKKAPDFAAHVDIHRKPGYDPLEMFWDHDKQQISQDTSLVKGSHGAPAKNGQRQAVFMLSGKDTGEPLPEEMNMVDVAPTLEKLLGS